MTNWLALTPADYVILGLLVVAFLEGCQRGLLAEVVRFGALLVTLLLAGRYHEPFHLWLNQRWQLEERLVRFLGSRLGLPPEAYQPEAVASPLQVADWLHHLPLPASYREDLLQRAAEWQPGQVAASPAHLILQHLAQTLASVLSYFILLALVGLLVEVAAGLLSHLLRSDPFLTLINRMAGGAVKVLETGVVVALVVVLVVPALAVAGFPWLQEQLAGAALTPYCFSLFDWLRSALFGPVGSLFSPV